MPFALRRFMGSRMCPINDVKTVMVQPVFKHETVGKIQGTIRSVSLPSYNNLSLYTSIFGTLDVNYSLFFVPWSVAATYTPTVDSVPSIPASIADFDKLMKRLVLVYGSTSNEFYSGNPDEATGTKLDLEKSPKNEKGTGADDNTEAVSDTELGLGPEGILRLYNSERFLMSTAKTDVGKTISSPDYSSDTSINDVTFIDNVDIDLPLNVAGDGFLIFCVTRYNTQATAGYACTYGSEPGVTPAITNEDRIRFLNSAFRGDMLRVKTMLADPTSILGQFARSVMFEGDTSVHPISDAANPVVGTLWTDDSPIRPNDILVNVKFALPFSTPYTIAPDFLG